MPRSLALLALATLWPSTLAAQPTVHLAVVASKVLLDPTRLRWQVIEGEALR